MQPIKVVTFGRSSRNDVVLHDAKASRVHCQIIQYDNGTFAISDFGSTNGTYVNGVRVNGQAPLRKTDRVQVAGNELFWQKYFTTEKPKSISKGWLWGGVSAAALILVAGVILAVMLIGNNRSINEGEIVYNGPEPPITVITLEEDGAKYDVEAAEGQLIVMFKKTVAHKEAVMILRKNDAKIIAQMPDVQYYLVEVPAGKESEFFSSIRNIQEVEYVFPNAIEFICSATSYVLDNFNAEHGKMVTEMLNKSGGESSEIKNIGSSDGKYVLSGMAVESTKHIIDNLGNNESAVINMSFGPGLVRLSEWIGDWFE